MNLTEAETKEIEKEALELYPDLPWADTVGLGIEDNSYTLRIGCIAGATAMAEKKNEEIEQWKEAKDKDILYWKQEAELQHSQLSDLRAELERVKVVVEKMAEAMKYVNDNTPGMKWKVMELALTEFANLMNKEMI